MSDSLSQAVIWAVDALRAGKVVLHPTETCYGLAADIFSSVAVDRVYALKNMSDVKPVSIMVSSFEEAKKYGVFSSLAEKFAREFWPGPLTIIVPRTDALPSFLNRGHNTVGIRCPGHDLTLEMLRTFGGPLVTTSANRTGESQAYEVEEFLKGRGEGGVGGIGFPDAIVDVGRIPEILPSTVVECVGDGYKIVRQGSAVL